MALPVHLEIFANLSVVIVWLLWIDAHHSDNSAIKEDQFTSVAKPGTMSIVIYLMWSYKIFILGE